MAAFTSSQSGNWSSTATWSGTGPPGTGDTATINHAVTVTADTVIGDGTATTVLTCNTTSSSLTVTGAKLTIRGNSLFGAYAGGTTRIYIDVANSGGTPGGIELDGNSGVSPAINFDYDSMLRIKGIATGRCFVRTKSGTAGAAGRIVSVGAIDRSLFIDAAYTDFTRLGDASHSGINSPTATWWVTGPAGYTKPPFRFDHCVFDTCGQIPVVSLGASGQTDYDMEIANCTWQNSADSTNSCQIQSNGNLPIVGGTRLIDSNLFLGVPPNFPDASHFTITNNYFDHNLNAGYSGPQWDSFDGNFIRKPINEETALAGNVTNCYVYNSAAGGVGFLISANGSSTIDSNVFESTVTTDACYAIGLTDLVLQARTVTITRNVMTTNGTGGATGELGAWSTSTSQGFNSTVVCEHNTVPVGSNNGAQLSAASGGPERTGMISSFRSNMFWRTGSAADYAFSNLTFVNPPVTDAVSATAIDHNAYCGLAVTGANSWTGTSGATTCTDGTVYNSPMSGSTAPGANDVNLGTGLANVTALGPKFVDPTRKLATWDASLGGAGTEAAALARLVVDPTLAKSSLIPYVRAGFAPQNTALHNTAHDGTDIGAVAYSPPPTPVTFIMG